MPRRGLEPPRLAAQVPETCASTNSAIWATVTHVRGSPLAVNRHFEVFVSSVEKAVRRLHAPSVLGETMGDLWSVRWRGTALRGRLRKAMIAPKIGQVENRSFGSTCHCAPRPGGVRTGGGRGRRSCTGSGISCLAACWLQQVRCLRRPAPRCLQYPAGGKRHPPMSYRWRSSVIATAATTRGAIRRHRVGCHHHRRRRFTSRIHLITVRFRPRHPTGIIVVPLRLRSTVCRAPGTITCGGASSAIALTIRGRTAISATTATSTSAAHPIGERGRTAKKAGCTFGLL